MRRGRHVEHAADAGTTPSNLRKHIDIDFSSLGESDADGLAAREFCLHAGCTATPGAAAASRYASTFPRLGRARLRYDQVAACND